MADIEKAILILIDLTLLGYFILIIIVREKELKRHRKGYIMYIVILPNKIEIDKSLKAINKKHDMLIEETELKTIGEHSICNMTNENIEFAQDKKRISSLAMNKLYKKNDSEMKIYLIVIMIISIIGLLQGCTVGGA